MVICTVERAGSDFYKAVQSASSPHSGVLTVLPLLMSCVRGTNTYTGANAHSMSFLQAVNCIKPDYDNTSQ